MAGCFGGGGDYQVTYEECLSVDESESCPPFEDTTIVPNSQCDHVDGTIDHGSAPVRKVERSFQCLYTVTARAGTTDIDNGDGSHTVTTSSGGTETTTRAIDVSERESCPSPESAAARLDQRYPSIGLQSVDSPGMRKVNSMFTCCYQVTVTCPPHLITG